MRHVLFWGGLILFVVWAGVRIFSDIQFNRNCKGYLKRAADANNIELAREELGKALQYMEYHQLTEGYASILYTTPDEDLGFWYKNIKAAHNQLLKIDPEAISDLEESNVLMKLRETLCDRSNGNTSVTVPSGISIYPFNLLWCIVCMLGAVACIFGGIRKVQKGDWPVLDYL